jgi:hypothetical protein
MQLTIAGISSSRRMGFPLTSFGKNSFDGALCLVGIEPEVSDSLADYDPKHISCDSVLNLWLILAFIVANACILECIDRLLKMRQDLQARSMIVSIFMAFIALGVYDKTVNFGFGIFNSNIGYLDLLSLAVLLVGMEVYGREDEPECEAIPLHLDKRESPKFQIS